MVPLPGPVLPWALALGASLVPADEQAHVRKLSGPLTRGFAADVTDFAATADERWVVFRADASVDGRFELHGVPADGSAPPRALGGPEAAEDRVLEYLPTPDGLAVVYTVDRGFRGGHQRLFRAPIDGSAPPLLLLAEDERSFASALQVSSDSRFVVFREDDLVTGRPRLSSLALDGSSPPARFDPGTPDAQIFSGRVSADARFVVFLAFGSSTGLYSAPIEGGPATRLDAPVLPTGRVEELQLAGDTVVYTSDAFVQGRFELFGVPIDGSAAPDLLSPPAGSESVSGLRVDPTGTWATYRLFAGPFGPVELDTVRVDGSAPALHVSRSGGLFGDTRTTVSGRVLFTARAPGATSGSVLYSAPLDGSAETVLLGNGPLNSTINLWELSPDGALVVYVVPVDRSVPPRRLNPSLAPHGTLFDFACSPDGAFVAYRANLRDRALVELWRVPLAGGAAPDRMSADLVPNGDVRAWRFVSSGELVYDADQDEDEAFELYDAVLGRRPVRTDPPRPPR